MPRSKGKRKAKHNYGDVTKQAMEWDFRKSASFVNIDRKQENADVAKFQRTNDIKLLETIYHRRVPSLQIWARRYSYLLNDFDDMYEELTFHFIKAVHGYNPRKGTSFNTFLFTTFLNCVRNIRSGQCAKKRRPKEAEESDTTNFMLSLDYNYSKKDGSESTLKEVIADELSSDDRVMDRICLEETIDVLAHEDPNIKGFLRKLSSGNTIAALLKEAKTKTGKVQVSRSMAKRLDTKRRCNRIVSDLIRDKKKIDDDFELLEYEIVSPCRIQYTIEMSKTEESDDIMRTVRNIRRDRERLLATLNG